jgi:pimeloyl-ACP methyl ester carboxylesterase
MPSVELAESRNAKIQVRLTADRGTIPRIVMAACGGEDMLARVSYPIAEMQQRGFGKSVIEDRSVKDFSLKDYMADFDAAIKTTRAKSPVILGYSHGGYFTTAYALHNPGAVSALILVEPALFTERAELEHRAELASKGDSDGAIQAMLSYVDRSVGLDRSKSTKMSKAIVSESQSSETLAQEFLIRARNPISKRDLTKLTMPDLLIGGTESRVADSVEKAAAVIPYANVAWIRGAGHLDLLWNGSAEVGAKVSAVINGFMETL